MFFQLLPTEANVTVIVRGSAPHIQLHGLIQQLLAAKLQGLPQGGALIQGIGKVFTGDGNSARGFADSHLAGGDTVHCQGSLVSAIGIGKRHFVKAQELAGGLQRPIVLQGIGQLQEALAHFGNGYRKRQRAVAVGRNAGRFGATLGNGNAVAGDFPGKVYIILKVGEVHIVMECQFTGFLIIGNHTGRTVDIAVFQYAGVGRPVGIYQAVHAEIAVVGLFAVVAAVPVHGLAVFGDTLVDGMVTPLPHKSAAVTVVRLEILEVVLQVAGAVTHGVAVFAENVGPVQNMVVLHALQEILIHLGQTGIHPAIQIQIAEVVVLPVSEVPCAFVVG